LNKPAQFDSRPVVDAIEAASADFLKLSLERPSDLSVWTKLYAASQAMLSAVRDDKVIGTLVEICSNLLGCEQLAIVEIERATAAVHFLGEEGLSASDRAALTQNARVVESKIHQDGVTIAEEVGDLVLVSMGISTLVALWTDQKSSCALVLFQLLPQRSGFDDEDREVLTLLSIYAGPCVRSQKGE
jgi:hypothetical protein